MTVIDPSRQNCTNYINGVSVDLFNVNNGLGVGVYQAPLSYYEVVPLAVSTTNIVNAQTPTENVAIPFNTASTFATNGAQYITYNGQGAIQLDCPRSIEITLSVSPTAQYLQMTGYDSLGQYMVKNVYLNNQFTVASTMGFYTITSAMIITSGFSGTISIGTNSTIALPYHALLQQYDTIYVTYGGSQIASSNVVAGQPWRYSGDDPTILTGDPRGLIEIPDTIDGIQVCTILYRAYGADSNLNAQLKNQEFTAEQIVNSNFYNTDIPRTADKPPSELTALDLTGVQYGYTYDAEGSLVWTPQMLAYFNITNNPVPTSI